MSDTKAGKPFLISTGNPNSSVEEELYFLRAIVGMAIPTFDDQEDVKRQLKAEAQAPGNVTSYRVTIERVGDPYTVN